MPLAVAFLSSELTQIALAAIGLGVVVTNVYGVIANARIATDAAREAREVKATLKETTAVSDAKLNVIHKLVNNDMTLAMREKAEALRRVATLTGIEADIHSAEVAEQALAARIDQAAATDAVAAVGAVSKAIDSAAQGGAPSSPKS